MLRIFDHKQVTNPGSPIHIIFAPVVDKNGNIDLVESGKENTDVMIQSYADSCDISIILANAANGDLSGLNKVKGMYGDFTKCPKTYAEFLQLQIDANGMFDKLPPDVKKNFDNDPNKFLISAGTEEWMNKIGINKENDENIEKGDTVENNPAE